QASQTTAMVQRVGERLANDKSGTVFRRPGEGMVFDLPERDAWGTPLHVVYGRHTVSETLTLRSAGPDRDYNSQDDIVFEASAYTAAGVLDGAGNIVREHLPAMPRWNPFGSKPAKKEGTP